MDVVSTISSKTVEFMDVRNGQCFRILPEQAVPFDRMTDRVWFKLDRNRAQDISDENLRREFPKSIRVNVVHLSVQ